jgi:hypothetical protein
VFERNVSFRGETVSILDLRVLRWVKSEINQP